MIRKLADRIVMIVGIYFLAAGFIGFLCLAISAEGAFDWLGTSVEWPMGYSAGVARTGDGYYVAINEMAGRVQYYDPEWKFLWGIRLDTGGGVFKIVAVKDDHFEIVTARLNNHYKIDYKGNILSLANYPESIWYREFGNAGRPAWVGTLIILIPFASPVLSFASIFAGGLLLILTATVIRKRPSPFQ